MFPSNIKFQAAIQCVYHSIKKIQTGVAFTQKIVTPTNLVIRIMLTHDGNLKISLDVINPSWRFMDVSLIPSHIQSQKTLQPINLNLTLVAPIKFSHVALKRTVITIYSKTNVFFNHQVPINYAFIILRQAFSENKNISFVICRSGLLSGGQRRNFTLL